MKISIQLLAIYLGFLMLNLITISSLEKEKSNTKTKEKENSITSNLLSKSKSQITSKSSSSTNMKPEPYAKIWKRLFHAQRGSACKSDKVARKLKKKLDAYTSNKFDKSKKGKFAWVKEWGFGKGSYLFDFLDSVLLDDVLGEFKKIYKDMFAMSNKDTAKYKDMLDIKKLLKGDKKQKKKAAKNLKKLNKNYEPKIYKISVNTVQLHTAMPKWKWPVDVGLKDFAKTFVKKYDMNGDGRLNPRELILGALEHNKHLFGTGMCTHCFEGVTDKIDALFQYMDCDNDGMIGSEDLWRNLPALKRPTSKYNIFALGRAEGIRTDAINDFILKNNKMTKGSLNKVEFRNGILYGIWDRQTDYFNIIDGTKHSLKNLRWKNGRIVDIKGFNTLKEIRLRKMKKKNKKNKKTNKK